MTTKERPILFSAPMVRALLDGSKNQTRRVITHKRYPVPSWATFGQEMDKDLFRWSEEQTPGQPLRALRRWPIDGCGPHAIPCPYGQPGDRLWVRESFAHIYRDNSSPERRSFEDVAYMADGRGIDIGAYGSWKPSIHMPRWASRITLEVTSVRVERLQDISRGEAMAEGCPFPNMAQGKDPCQWYGKLWEQINGPDSWEANPWVWVIEFKRINQAAA